MDKTQPAETDLSFNRVGECLWRNHRGTYFALVKLSGKQIKRSLKTNDFELAKRKLASFRKSLKNIDPRIGKVTVGMLREKYLQSLESLEAKTIKTRRGFALRFEEAWPHGMNHLVRDVKPSDITAWLSSYRKNISRATYNEYLRFIKHLFKIAVSDKIIAESPADDIKPLKREKPIRNTPTYEEFYTIVNDIRAQRFNADAQDSADFVEFIGLSGLGNSEAANLTWGDIDLNKKQIRVYRNKTDQGFSIPVYPQLEPFLEKLLAKHRSKPSFSDSVLKIKDAKKAITAACDRLKLPHYSHRSFRRTFITQCVELGIDFKTISAWQGHNDGGVLIAKTYSHLRQEHSNEMAKKLVMADKTAEAQAP